MAKLNISGLADLRVGQTLPSIDAVEMALDPSGAIVLDNDDSSGHRHHHRRHHHHHNSSDESD